MEEVHQVLVRLLDGKHKALNFTNPSISVESIKHRIHEITSIPFHHQLLLSNGQQLHDHQILIPNWSDSIGEKFPAVVYLLLRLRGGKGGFGSLLRGAATKAGQKKTNNFDACRDMSGRRLRHVNAEKKMEEWRAEAEERKLEKIAEEFIKKKAKAAKKGGSSGDSEKYVEKYRKDSAKCMEEVERTVRESMKGFVNSKRKAAVANELEAKRLKIWSGKRKMGDSDSDNMDEDDSSEEEEEEEEENEKSVVIDNGNHPDSDKEAERSSGSVTGEKRNGVSSAGGSSESGSEEEETVVKGSSESVGNPEDGAALKKGNDIAEPALKMLEEKEVVNGAVSCLEASIVSGSEAVQDEVQESNETGSHNLGEIVILPPSTSSAGEGEASSVEVNGSSDAQPVVYEETVSTSADVLDLKKPLNFDEFSSAAEMEVLGMERLKSELQARGLKCGGTLQERAARLFLLKTTPLEKLPKKLLAKK